MPQAARDHAPVMMPGAQCAVCHQRVTRPGGERPGVWLGRPSLRAPGVCACRDCLLVAVELADALPALAPPVVETPTLPAPAVGRLRALVAEHCPRLLRGDETLSEHLSAARVRTQLGDDAGDPATALHLITFVVPR